MNANDCNDCPQAEPIANDCTNDRRSALQTFAPAGRPA